MRSHLVFLVGALFACASQPAPVPHANAPAAAPPATAAPTPRGTPNAIAGWFLAGSGPAHYRAERDPDVKHGGPASARLRSVDDPAGTFGTLMQRVSSRDYLGKRVRLSAFVRTVDVREWSGLWLRVDQKSGVQTLDNMQGRPIRGNTEWTRYDVVLDVPADAVSLNFGVLQTGAGTTWLDDVSLEPVDSSVGTTENLVSESPKNLAFDE